MPPVIETNLLKKTYTVGNQTVHAVDDVSMQIQPGEFIGLVGPSGSGKTTMLAMMAALLRPTEGCVAIDGVKLRDMNEQQRVRFRREKIGFTFQANNLLPYLTVMENVYLMLQLNQRTTKNDKAYAKEVLGRLGLGDRLNSLPRQLSGGQQQRVSIARSLIHNPSVVLADEPTASLDTERAFQVVELYADLIHEQNKVGVMVTHDLRMCKYVDRMIQMRDGKIDTILETRQEIDEYISCG
ncbi:MAG: ABC transporter ATP-binding protein [Anaerolineaceae bacterium]|nr:ABC transporter ATP-binding protein [Anaerolineaceae bacterium]